MARQVEERPAVELWFRVTVRRSRSREELVGEYDSYPLAHEAAWRARGQYPGAREVRIYRVECSVAEVLERP